MDGRERGRGEGRRGESVRDGGCIGSGAFPTFVRVDYLVRRLADCDDSWLGRDLKRLCELREARIESAGGASDNSLIQTPSFPPSLCACLVYAVLHVAKRQQSAGWEAGSR